MIRRPARACQLNQTTGHSYTATVAAVGVRFIGPVAGLDKSGPYDLGATRLSLRSRPVCTNPLWFDLAAEGGIFRYSFSFFPAELGLKQFATACESDTVLRQAS